jgi:hypothetical protein
VKKESSGEMYIPWEQLVITEDERTKNMNKCSSSLEIPWDDILFNPNMKIDNSNSDLIKCDKDEIEIPWNDLLIPKSVIKLQKKMNMLNYSCKIRPKMNNKCGYSIAR